MHTNEQTSAKWSRGISLVEMLIVIAIIGVLSSISVVAYKNVKEKGKETVATSLVETLNKGTRKFGHAMWELDYPAELNDATEEVYLLKTLQYRDASDPSTGAPYVRPDWIPLQSSSTDDYRLYWRGRSWGLLKPGEAGAGLLVDFDGSDMGTMQSFPAGFELARSGR